MDTIWTPAALENYKKYGIFRVGKKRVGKKKLDIGSILVKIRDVKMIYLLPA
jgi:hypothetical protein